MAGEESTRPPVSNSQRAVPGFLAGGAGKAMVGLDSGLTSGKPGMFVDGTIGGGEGDLVLDGGTVESGSGVVVSANSAGSSLRKKYKPPAATNPPKINRTATIAITRGALLFDSGADVAFKDGPTEGVGDATLRVERQALIVRR